MKMTRMKGVLVASCAVLVLAALFFGPGALRAYRNPDPHGGGGNRVTLNPDLFVGSVHEAYQAARDHPELLAQLHCYCGCDKVQGHKNLLDCFRDSHGGHCPICVHEVLDAERMYNQGTPVEQIRATLRTLYHHES